MATYTIAQALQAAHRLGVARLDAQLLLSHHLQRPRTWLLAHEEAALTAPQTQAYGNDLTQRAAGVPLAYLVGEREFYGLKLHVNPAVLVPRPETEGLVDWALERLAVAPAMSVLDLGTGSGAIALALARAAPLAAVTATDASADALAVARANAARHALKVEFVHGSWWTPLSGRRWGLAVANPPYVAAADAHLLDLIHEPQCALTPGKEGLEALREVISGAAKHLLPGAWLLLEHGHDQAVSVTEMLHALGFISVQTRFDLAGMPRLTGAASPQDATI